MSVLSPFSNEEAAFAKRLLFETLHFADDIEKSAEPKFWQLRLQNGAIENFLRAMDLSSHEYRSSMYDGPEPEPIAVCPWESQAAFLLRNAEICKWIACQKGRPTDIKSFISTVVSE